MLLVGSKALQAYMPLNRVIHDWDIWMTDAQFDQFLVDNNQFVVKRTPHTTVFDKHGVIVEVKRQSQFAPTDQQIWEQQLFQKQEIETPFGICRVPDIQTVYDMKASTALCIEEWKHKYDQDLIEKHYGDRIQKDSELFKARLIETQERVAKSKKNLFGFFHKTAHEKTKINTIPEYIVHDRLHDLISDLTTKTMPTFQRIVTTDYKPDMELFRALPYHLKVDLMVEESLVLALERWFIPQMVENGINHKLIPRFYNNNEASPTYMLLKHVNIKGLIGEEPEITQFGRDNFAEIEKRWIWMKREIEMNGGFPQWFFEELFELRDRYRNGEKVGIHHNKQGE